MLVFSDDSTDSTVRSAYIVNVRLFETLDTL